VIEALTVINETFDGVLGKIPCYNTIGNWIKKYGLDVYNSSGQSLKDKDFAELTDESMMIGSEKLLLTLGIPSRHQGQALCHKDLDILDMAVSTGWTEEAVEMQLKKAAEKVGHKPQYVISDNASIMNKGIRLSGIPHHRDISHTLGMYLERTYKEADDFKAYIKDMANVKFKHNMKKAAYLLPPTQRIIARFINLSNWVTWSHKMQEIYHTLSAEEKQIYSFIPANASFIDELREVMCCIEAVESICKHEGLSQSSVLKCQLHIRKTLAKGNQRMIKLACDVLSFLKSEVAMIESDQDVRNNSSDIIESVFGTYKKRKSPNKLYGVTPFILFLPAHIQLLKDRDTKNFLFKERLERIRLKDINEWASKKLSPNLVSMRNQTLKKVC